MRAILSFVAFLLLVLPSFAICPVWAGGDGGADADADVQVGLELGRVAGNHITRNMGQIPHEGVLYHSSNVYFTGTGLVYRVMEAMPENGDAGVNGPVDPVVTDPAVPANGHIFKIAFSGARPVVPAGNDELSFHSNFFLGGDSSKWATEVPNYRGLVYEGLYDGIDLTFGTGPDGMYSEFVVRPGGDVRELGLEYDGAEVDVDGNAVSMETSVGTFFEEWHYAEGDGEAWLPARLAVRGSTVSFEMDCSGGCRLGNRPAMEADADAAMAIGPMDTPGDLTYSTFIGGTYIDYGYANAVDSSGNAYITGTAISMNFPTTVGAYDTSLNSSDAFVTKLNSTGSSLVYSTYLGGTLSENGLSIAIDTRSNAYITGLTSSSDFPNTTGAYDNSKNGAGFNNDVFVTKLNSSGSSLAYSTYLGGSGEDTGWSIVLDSSDNAYVTGETGSSDFPNTTGAYDNSYNGGLRDVFVTKLNSVGSSLTYSTYLGGSTIEGGNSLAVDSAGNAYITGYTGSSNFPNTTGALDNTWNGTAWATDGFVTKLNSAGSSLVYSTYLGGTVADGGKSIEVDTSGNAYVTGSTTSPDFPTTIGAYDTTFNGNVDVFAIKLNSNGSSLVYSTFIGGSVGELGTSIALDSSGNAYITGNTSSSNFPNTTGAYDTTFNLNNDVFVIKLNPAGSSLMYSTFIGGNSSEYGNSLAIDSSGNVYVTGYLDSGDFPNTTGAFDNTFNTFNDVFALKLFQSVINYAPDPPQSLTASAGDGYVQLNWSPPAKAGSGPVTNYTVFRGGNETSLSKLSVLGNLTGYNDTGVTNGVRYFYMVSATNFVGTGGFSNIVNATPGARPTEPLGLAAVSGIGFVDLSWSPPLDVKGFDLTGYNVLRGPSAASLGLVMSLGNVTLWNDTGVTNGVTYYYAVTALNARGESGLSNVVNATPGALPTAPRNLTVRETGYRYVDLSWEAPANNGGFGTAVYRVFKGLSGAGPTFYKQVDETGLHDIEVENGETYDYSVSAVNGMGEGPRSDMVSATPGWTPGVVYFNLTAGDGSVSVTWDEPDDGGFAIIQYRVRRGTAPSSMETVNETDGMMFNDTGLENGVEYFYTVNARNALGWGALEQVLSAMPVAVKRVPGPPENLTAHLIGSSVILTWDPPADDGGLAIGEYIVYKGSGAPDVADLAHTVDTMYNDSKVDVGVKYYYVVSAVNDIGEGPLSSMVDVMFKVNHNPRFTSTPPLAVKVGDEYLYQVEAMDEDGDGFTFYFNVKPDGMEMDAGEVVRWTPTIAGDYGVELVVTDAYGASDTQNWVIRVVEELVVVSVKLVTPDDGSSVKGTFRVGGTATINMGSISRVEVKMGGSGWMVANGTISWYIDIDSTKLKNGMYNVTARATDGYFYSPEVSIKVDVRNPEKPPDDGGGGEEPAGDEQETETGLLPWWMILLLVLVITTVVVAIVILRRRKPPTYSSVYPRKEVETREVGPDTGTGG